MASSSFQAFNSDIFYNGGVRQFTLLLVLCFEFHPLTSIHGNFSVCVLWKNGFCCSCEELLHRLRNFIGNNSVGNCKIVILEGYVYIGILNCFGLTQLSPIWIKWILGLLVQRSSRFVHLRGWHSTKVALTFLTQLPRVRISALLRYFFQAFSSQYCLVGGQY